MPHVSPSSRLVLATVVAAVVVLVLVGALHARGPTPPESAGMSNAAVASTSPSPGAASAGGPFTATPTGTRAPTPTPYLTPKPKSKPNPQPTPKPVACKPTDQDGYVYNPDRLEVLAACVYVTGTIDAVRREADGDLHILLKVDAAYRYLLRPANQGEELGDLVVEPVCVKSVTQTDAIATCESDPDPLSSPFPIAGDRVWMEGRYVLDLDHGGWAELHPLYRWGYR